MNQASAKGVVETLRYISAVADNCLMQTWDEGRDAKEIVSEVEAMLEDLCGAVSNALQRLPMVDPDFVPILKEVDREAIARGKAWSAERAEKIALLRLSGDDTPEEQIP